jgi:hypothetical protein
MRSTISIISLFGNLAKYVNDDLIDKAVYWYFIGFNVRRTRRCEAACSKAYRFTEELEILCAGGAMIGQEKEIVRYLSGDDHDRLIAQTDNEKESRRPTFIKQLYKGATLEDAADGAEMSQLTSSRWVKF